MFYDIDIWRFVITLGFAKSLTWERDGKLCLFSISRIEGTGDRAVTIIFLPFLLMIGLARPS